MAASARTRRAVGGAADEGAVGSVVGPTDQPESIVTNPADRPESTVARVVVAPKEALPSSAFEHEVEPLARLVEQECGALMDRCEALAGRGTRHGRRVALLRTELEGVVVQARQLGVEARHPAVARV